MGFIASFQRFKKLFFEGVVEGLKRFRILTGLNL